jgi:hypothetical protein
MSNSKMFIGLHRTPTVRERTPLIEHTASSLSYTVKISRASFNELR